MNIDKSKPVLVTGATGYVAGWLVKELLDAGITVHAAVRNPDGAEKLKYLNKIAAESKGKIKYFKSDLLAEGSYEEAMHGCELVFHTASPFTLRIKDAQKDLIDPALSGTRNVLNSANKIDSVKRAVLTSSCAAIIGDTIDIVNLPNGTADENIWNETSSLTDNPYSYSKTLAEKEAWKISKSQDRWDLVVINPSLVLGPGINPNITSESLTLIKMLGDGTYKMGAPAMDIGVVDVRDLAIAHFNAGYFPEANGRNIISAYKKNFLQMAEILRPKYGDKYPLPKKTLPKWLLWLMAPISGVTRKYVSNNIGYPFNVDNSKSVKELNIKYRPFEETITDFFQQMVDAGIL